jgi:hypothetical protein
MPDENNLPRARVENIVSRKVLDEVIIYDKTRDVGTALNAFAAEVWDRCDGQSSPAAIAQALSQSRSGPVDERAVWLAVDKLSRAKLLEEPVKMPPSVLGEASRREAMRSLGLGAAAAVPVVLSIKVPTAAQAASCLPSGAPCDVLNPGVCCMRSAWQARIYARSPLNDIERLPRRQQNAQATPLRAGLAITNTGMSENQPFHAPSTLRGCQ